MRKQKTMINRMSFVCALAGVVLCFCAGCGNDSADSENEDSLCFVIYDSADRLEYEPGVRVFSQEDKMELDSTAEFECETGNLDLEQVRVAAFCQCLAALAGFLNAEIFAEESGDCTNDIKTSTSCRIGAFQIDSMSAETTEKTPSRRTQIHSSETMISDGGDISVVIRTFSEHDTVEGDSIESEVDMPLGFTVEKFLGLLSKSGASFDILYEQIEFESFDLNRSMRVSPDSKDVVSLVKQLLAKNGGTCRYKVCIHFRPRGN